VTLGSSVRQVQDDIQNAIDAIDTFPDSAKRPRISAQKFRESVLWLIISGIPDEKGLKYFAKQIKDEMLALSEISQVFIEGARDHEITIEVNPDKLRQHNLTVETVADSIRKSSFNLPIGSIKSQNGEILLRSKGQAYNRQEFASISLRATPNGGTLRVGDIAEVKDGFEDSDWFFRFQGNKAVGLQVFRVGEQSTLEVADAAKAYITKKRAELPQGVTLDIIANTATPLRDRLNMMLKNLLFGGLLVFITLALFLRLRVAFWVMVGLPISFLGTLWLMPMAYFDLSINMISLFGFILVLGIVVDDAIVIGESAYSHQQKHGFNLQRVIEGAQKVAMPATFGVLTTVAVFLPILMIPGVNGKLWSGVAWVVILSLLFSLVESKLILPAHLARIKHSKPKQKGNLLDRIQQRVSLGMKWVIHQLYRPSLEHALSFRYSTLAIFIGIMLITAGIVESGLVRMVFFPDIEGDVIQVELEMQPGTPFSTTEKMARRVEQGADKINATFKQEQNTAHDIIPYLIAFSTEERKIFFYAELAPSNERILSASDIIELWRKQTGLIPGIQQLTFSGMEQGDEQALNFQLEGRSFQHLRDAANTIKKRLSNYEDGYEVCTKLKQNEKHKDTPVIFATAKRSVDDLLRGFQVGGADYVTKPYNPAELLARVNAHITIKLAMEEIQALRGIIPICSSCKKIRDDEGVWNRIEQYIEAHSEVLFTHGLCHECEDKMYGGQEWYEKMKKNR